MILYAGFIFLCCAAGFLFLAAVNAEIGLRGENKLNLTAAAWCCFMLALIFGFGGLH